MFFVRNHGVFPRSFFPAILLITRSLVKLQLELRLKVWFHYELEFSASGAAVEPPVPSLEDSKETCPIQQASTGSYSVATSS